MTCTPFRSRWRVTLVLIDLHPISVQMEGYSGLDFSGFGWLCNHSKGDKSPKELCGLNRLYSSLHVSKCNCTSAMFSNQWVARNSSRSFPLNDSQKALSVGLPGREKHSFTPRPYAQASKAFPANSGPLSRRIVLGSPCATIARFKTSQTRSPVILKSASKAGLTRLTLSTNERTRNALPSESRSDTKSMHHRSLGATASGQTARGRATLFFLRVLSLSSKPSCL